MVLYDNHDIFSVISPIVKWIEYTKTDAAMDSMIRNQTTEDAVFVCRFFIEYNAANGAPILFYAIKR